MTTSTSKPKPTTDQDQPYYIHSIMTLKVRFVVNLEKSLEHRVPENGFAFCRLCTVCLRERMPIRPCHYLLCAIKVIQETCRLPSSNPFFGRTQDTLGVLHNCCLLALLALARMWRRKEGTKTPIAKSPITKSLEPKELKSWSIRQRLQTQLGQQSRWRTWQQIHRCRTHKQHLMAWRRHQLWNCQQQEWNWRNLIG